MNSLTKMVLFGSILLFLVACTHYPRQAYYPADGAYPVYSGGTVVTQRSYYGGYPYRYDNYNDHVYENYYHDHHDGYRTNPAWNYGRRLKAYPSNSFDQHDYQKSRKWDYKGGAANYYPDHSHQNDNRRKHPSNYSRKQYDQKHGRPNPHPQNYGQHHRSDDKWDGNRGSRKNKWATNEHVMEHRRFDKARDIRNRNVYQEELKRQRKN